MRPPAFQFYAGDFMVGVLGLTDEEVGVYIKMLSMQWERGALPNDPAAIKRLVNSQKKPSENVLSKFTKGADGLLRNSRLEETRVEQENYSKSRVENANKRWNKKPKPDAHASAVHEPMHNSSICTGDALQSPTPPPSITHTPREDDSQGGVAGQAPKFEQFAAECARYQVPEWYAQRKFDDFTVKGWMSGKTPIVWRDAVRMWVVRDHHNEGRPLTPQRARGGAPQRSGSVQPSHENPNEEL